MATGYPALMASAADAAGDPALAGRTWVLLTEAPDGGWGLAGHANTNEELVAAARAQIASLAASEKTSGYPAAWPFSAAALRAAPGITVRRGSR
jgi:hypothetical protein